MANVVRKVDKNTEQEIKRIIDTICTNMNLSKKCIMGRFGAWDCSDARFILVKIIKDRFYVTDIYIGSLFKRNTPMFAFNSQLKCNELLKCNKKFRERYFKAISYIDAQTKRS